MEEARRGSRARLFVRSHARAIFLALTVGIFNQLTGINSVLYFLNDIFAASGLNSEVTRPGTLLLVANSIENATHENFIAWYSTDQGSTWTTEKTFATGYSGGSPSTGIWEPFLYVDGSGRLVCVFSDERRAPARSQFLGEIISTNGGGSWSAESDVVVGPTSAGPATEAGLTARWINDIDHSR
jgi:hypothetical protein